MAERKKVKGKKPAETMRQAQRRKLAEQRAKKARAKGVKTNPTGPARGAQGPARPPVQGPSRRTPSTMGGDTGRRGGVNKYGTKGTPKSGPPGIGKPPRFNPSIRTAAKTPLGAAGLAIATGAALGEAYRRTNRVKAESGRGAGRRTFNEGPAPKKPYSKPPKTESKPGVQGRNTKGGQGGSRAAVNRKPKPPAKPKREVTSRNRRGRPTSFAKPVKPAKRGMSNIPPGEGTGKGSPNDRPKVKAQAKPKATTKPAAKPPKKDPKPKVTPQVAKTEKPKATAEKKQKKKKPLSKRKQMLNRRYAKLQAAAKAPGASARDRMRARKARKYT